MTLVMENGSIIEVNSIPKIEYDKKLGGWRCNNIPVPNWTPNSVKFGSGTMIINEKWFDKVLRIKKKDDKMLDEDQKKLIVDQLTRQKKTLEGRVESWKRQTANAGKYLFDSIDELDKINNVLDEIKKVIDDNEDEDGEE